MKSNSSFGDDHIQDKKNIKNIYVHKINSLMKLSKDTQMKDDFENSSFQQKKKVRQISSLLNKTSLKLQKNRESAKKARMRKKIYIKMLESQIQNFRRIQAEGQLLNQQSQAFLENQRKEKVKNSNLESIEKDINVQKFLSGDNLSKLIKDENLQYEERLSQRDKKLNQLYEISTSSLFKKLKNTSNLDIFLPLLTDKTKEEVKRFKLLIHKISKQYENIKEQISNYIIFSQFRKLNQLTQISKELSKDSRLTSTECFDVDISCRQIVTVRQFMKKVKLFDEESMDQEFMQLSNKQDLQSGVPKQVDFNMHSIEKILIRSQKFFQQTEFERQQ